jgi:RNA polymerase sigma factor (sigma-70 family)
VNAPSFSTGTTALQSTSLAIATSSANPPCTSSSPDEHPATAWAAFGPPPKEPRATAASGDSGPAPHSCSAAMTAPAPSRSSSAGSWRAWSRPTPTPRCPWTSPTRTTESPALADTLGAQEEALEGVEYRQSLKPLLEDLPPRERRILLLRFFANMTQSQIAQEVGISQMHVSRLLARTLAQLREKLLVEE